MVRFTTNIARALFYVVLRYESEVFMDGTISPRVSVMFWARSLASQALITGTSFNFRYGTLSWYQHKRIEIKTLPSSPWFLKLGWGSICACACLRRCVCAKQPPPLVDYFEEHRTYLSFSNQATKRLVNYRDISPPITRPLLPFSSFPFFPILTLPSVSRSPDHGCVSGTCVRRYG